MKIFTSHKWLDFTKMNKFQDKNRFEEIKTDLELYN